jgi:hypothetical protein
VLERERARAKERDREKKMKPGLLVPSIKAKEMIDDVEGNCKGAGPVLPRSCLNLFPPRFYPLFPSGYRVNDLRKTDKDFVGRGVVHGG